MMNIAIKGHPTRGKEVIQILESLGGVNRVSLKGNEDSYYCINSDLNNVIYCHGHYYANKYCKKYTLEEFEKEFPFKMGDLCICHTPFRGDIIVKILGMSIKNGEIMYEVDHKDTTRAHSHIYKRSCNLEPYKEMKEERNITLTLDKAKEWYQKGGELKEIALQAYSKEELTKIDLPKTWEEYVQQHFHREGYVLTHLGDVAETTITGLQGGKNLCLSKKSAEAHLAMMQLEQLRDCYRGLFVTVIGMPVWCIVRYKGELIISQRRWGTNETFLSFQAPEIAEKYLKSFKPLIEKAGDLI